MSRLTRDIGDMYIYTCPPVPPQVSLLRKRFTNEIHHENY